MDEPRITPGCFGSLGCLSLAAVFCLMCLLPFVLVNTMQLALERLHLSPEGALLSVLAIFGGSLINLPVHRIERLEPQPVLPLSIFGYWGPLGPKRVVQMRTATVIAINVGGCVVPILLAIWQISFVLQTGGWPVGAMLLISAANIGVCYAVARPIPGVGIAMPGFVSPLTAVALTWLLLLAGPPAYRAPVAFVAGVAGPLIGADLLHLKDITRVSTGMLSIGGAGTFDGIVLSGVLAALLA